MIIIIFFKIWNYLHLLRSLTKKKMKLNLGLGALVLSVSAFAQLSVEAELRPRFEYRHGFKTLFDKSDDEAAFVSQRTRLNANYKNENMEFRLSLQDVRVWGDVPQLNATDKNKLAVHEAWGKFNVTEEIALKLGRQEIVYDDSRFFGNVDWAQQARSHDAALAQFKKNNFRADVGFAYNQDGEKLTGNIYTVDRNYKSMQYAWLHHDWVDFSGSLLFVNNGWQLVNANSGKSETQYTQTIGTHLNYKANALNLIGNAYYQMGKDIDANDVSAYLLGLEANYNVTTKFNLGIGAELQSGNDNKVIANDKNKAFNPLFGTNHKFNGLMDYFYVGNHLNSVGLLDLHAKANIKTSEKTNVGIALHNFSSAADLDKKRFGNELDITFGYKIYDNVTLNAGYSHMFASDGMELIKNGKANETNNWAWLMFTFKPTLFSTK